MKVLRKKFENCVPQIQTGNLQMCGKNQNIKKSMKVKKPGEKPNLLQLIFLTRFQNVCAFDLT